MYLGFTQWARLLGHGLWPILVFVAWMTVNFGFVVGDGFIFNSTTQPISKSVALILLEKDRQIGAKPNGIVVRCRVPNTYPMSIYSEVGYQQRNQHKDLKRTRGTLTRWVLVASGQQYPPSHSCVVLTQAQHGCEK